MSKNGRDGERVYVRDRDRQRWEKEYTKEVGIDRDGETVYDGEPDETT